MMTRAVRNAREMLPTATENIIVDNRSRMAQWMHQVDTCCRFRKLS